MSAGGVPKAERQMQSFRRDMPEEQAATTGFKTDENGQQWRVMNGDKLQAAERQKTLEAVPELQRAATKVLIGENGQPLHRIDGNLLSALQGYSEFAPPEMRKDAAGKLWRVMRAAPTQPAIAPTITAVDMVRAAMARGKK
jgi:hypothetical protein